jgi:hypothetical protein
LTLNAGITFCQPVIYAPHLSAEKGVFHLHHATELAGRNPVLITVTGCTADFDSMCENATKAEPTLYLVILQ